MIRYIQPKDGGFFHEFLKWKFLKFMARYPNLKYRVETGDSYEVQYDTTKSTSAFRNGTTEQKGISFFGRVK